MTNMQKNIGIRLHMVVVALVMLLSPVSSVGPCIGAGAAFGQTKAEKIDVYMERCADQGLFNGSVLVAEHGKVIFKKGYGFADMEWEVPCEADTKFRLASITKQFVAVAVLQLVQQGKLRLDGKITEYLPDYPKATGDRVTIHHLLSNSSGIVDYVSLAKYVPEGRGRLKTEPDEFIKVFKDSALHFAPGTKFEYSSSGYFLLGRIIEKVTGKSFGEAVQEQIFGPLGMKNSGYDRPRAIVKKRARGYDRSHDTLVNAEFVDISVVFSAGGLSSTVEDLYLWDQALYGDRLLSADLKRAMFSRQVPVGRRAYGYGWFIGKAQVGSSRDSVEVVEHPGGMVGVATLISRIPSEQHLIVLLTNVGGTRLDAIARAIRGILDGRPYNVPAEPGVQKPGS